MADSPRLDGRRRWPLLLIGASAGTATWSGWVGLGELTGFGVVHPLPGIWDHLTLNTAITLPVGVEAYAVYALAVATDARPLTPLARRWAWGSAAGALLLGMGGQIAYHLLAARDVTTAPAWVVALVSSLPVLVLGAASLLWHLAAVTPTDAPLAATVSADASVPVSLTVVPATRPDTVASTPAAPALARPSADDRQPYSPPRPGDGAVSGAIASRAPGRPGSARSTITATVASPSDDEVLALLDNLPAGGDLPSIRALMRDHGIGQARATRIHREATTRRAHAASAGVGPGRRGGAAPTPPTGSDTDDDPSAQRTDEQPYRDEDPDSHREKNQPDQESQHDSDHQEEHHEDSQKPTGDDIEESPNKIHK